MRALLVLCALAAPALANPEVEARIAADSKLKPIDPSTTKPVTSWKCERGLMTDALVSWSCTGRSGEAQDLVTGYGVHRAFVIKDGKLVPFDLLAEVTSK